MKVLDIIYRILSIVAMVLLINLILVALASYL